MSIVSYSMAAGDMITIRIILINYLLFKIIDAEIIRIQKQNEYFMKKGKIWLKKQLLFPLQMTKANDEPVNSRKEKS